MITQFLEAINGTAIAQVVTLIDVVGLVEPVPPAATGEGKRTERVRFRVGLGRIDVNAVDRIDILRAGEEGAEVGLATGASIDVTAVVHVARVVTFRGIALDHDALPQAVSRKAHALDVIGDLEEGMRCGRTEIEGNVSNDPLMIVGCASDLGSDIRIGNCGILPINAARRVRVSCEDKCRVGALFVPNSIRRGLGTVGPLTVLRDQSLDAVLFDNLALPPGIPVVFIAVGLVVGRVGFHTDGDLIGVDHEVGAGLFVVINGRRGGDAGKSIVNTRIGVAIGCASGDSRDATCVCSTLVCIY